MPTNTITKEDISRFEERVKEMQLSKERNFFRTQKGLREASDGIRELISRYKQKLADSYWEEIKSKLIN